VPAEIRHRWGRAPLALEDHGDHVVLRPAPDDPIAAARGALKAIVSDLTREDMRRQARKEDADRERECRSGEDRPRRLRAHCPALDEPGAEAGILREETPQSRASTTARRSPRLVRAGGAPEQRVRSVVDGPLAAVDVGFTIVRRAVKLRIAHYHPERNRCRWRLAATGSNGAIAHADSAMLAVAEAAGIGAVPLASRTS
jgi:hypothetical protein